MKLRIIKTEDNLYNVQRKVLGMWFLIYNKSTFDGAKDYLLKYKSDNPPANVIYEYDSTTKKETYY